MAIDFDAVFDDVSAWAKRHGIAVRRRKLPRRKAGEFDGLSATMNSAYPADERVYYLTHALGSLVRWSLSRPQVQAMFDELRDAKKAGPGERLELAIAAYRAFETESSQFAVWLLAELGQGEAVGPFTNFMRADLEALTQFHRTGKAPVWREFFARWNGEVAAGTRPVELFEPKPVPRFTPLRTERQEILQEQG